MTIELPARCKVPPHRVQKNITWLEIHRADGGYYLFQKPGKDAPPKWDSFTDDLDDLLSDCHRVWDVSEADWESFDRSIGGGGGNPPPLPPESLVEETFAVAATGEPVRLRRTPDGRPLCPVCDVAWPSGAETAWRATGDRTPAGVLTVVPSWSICPGCSTQFGLDDGYDAGSDESLESAWAALRNRWQRR
jgi:hypothetical protein